MKDDITKKDSFSRKALARELLYYKMREYSQDGFCASWLVDLEFEIWNKARSSTQTTETGESTWLKAQARECYGLGEVAGGWWVWRKTGNYEKNNKAFISMTEWMEILEQFPAGREP